MNKSYSKRLSKVTPKDGGVDLSFSLTSAGNTGKVASTLTLKIYGPNDKGGMNILKSITISAIDADLKAANQNALEDALVLLGV